MIKTKALTLAILLLLVPVVASPQTTVGYTQEGATFLNASAVGLYSNILPAELTQNTTVDTAHAFLWEEGSGTTWAKIVLYEDDGNGPGAFVAATDSFEVSGAVQWYHLPITATLAANTEYWYGIINDGSSVWCRADVDAAYDWAKNYSPSWPEPVDPETTNQRSEHYRISIYFSASGGQGQPAPPAVRRRQMLIEGNP